MSNTNLFRPLTMAARMAAYRLKQCRRRPPRHVPGVHLDRDVPVAMRDGSA